MRQAGEPVLVQGLVTPLSVERLDIGILVRLAWLDQPQRGRVLMRPVQHRLACELLAIVRPNNRGPAALRADIIEQAD